MRVYYIFLIKKEMFNFTKNNPEALYKLFESIYYLKDPKLAFTVFDKVALTFNKGNINKLIRDSSSDNLSYSMFGCVHNINDYLNNETTKLEVKNSHLLLKSNVMYPEFFKTLSSIPYLFVCDFQTMDYFYLKDVTLKELAR